MEVTSSCWFLPYRAECQGSQAQVDIQLQYDTIHMDNDATLLVFKPWSHENGQAPFFLPAQVCTSSSHTSCASTNAYAYLPNKRTNCDKDDEWVGCPIFFYSTFGHFSCHPRLHARAGKQDVKRRPPCGLHCAMLAANYSDHKVTWRQYRY